VLVVVAIRHESEAERWRAEAERWQAEAERRHAEARKLAAEKKVLRAENKALLARVEDLEGRTRALVEKVATLSRLLFGDKSEKEKKEKEKKAKPPADNGSGGGSGGGGDGGPRPRGQQPGSPGHGRRNYSHLETMEQVYDVSEDERACSCCGAAYEPFGEETSQQIDWIVRIVRVLHIRRKYRRTCNCATSPGVLARPVPPKPIRKGLFTSLFLARLLVEKYVLGRPLERIVAALQEEGFDVAKGTLVGALKAVSELVAPLDQAIRHRNAEAAHLHVDETGWRVFEDLPGKETNRWWLWVFLALDTVVFLIDPTRSMDVAADHLGIDLTASSLTDGRRLLLSSDFYSVYQSLATIDGVEPLYCWAHFRRRVVRARDAHPYLKNWADAWLERIGALYAAHRAFQATEPGSPEAIKAAADIAGALAEIDRARQAEMADETLFVAAAEVLANLDREWEGLSRHQSFPELPMDNNPAERALRNPVVLRKNCYGSGSAWAATLAARVWTITATAGKAGCSPLSYLWSYLEACAAAGGRAPKGKALRRFFPWAASEADLGSWRAGGKGPAP